MQTMYYIEYISLAREGVFMVTKLNLYVYCFIGLVSKRGDMCAPILDSFLLIFILPRRTHFNWKHGVMGAQENLGLFVWVRVLLLLLLRLTKTKEK